MEILGEMMSSDLRGMSTRALRTLESMSGGLGKRCNNDAFEDHLAMEWIPGAGVQCDPCGDHTELARRSKAHRTSLLFAELEREVRAEREATWLARRARNCRDLRISAELAARFPMRTDDDQQSEDTRGEDKVEEAQRAEQLVPVAGKACSEKSARRGDVNALPAPLTEQSLAQACAELPMGARNMLLSCVACFRSRTLGSGDVVETVRSFAKQSKTIRDLLTAAGTNALPELLGEAATEDDMLDLARMAGVQLPPIH